MITYGGSSQLGWLAFGALSIWSHNSTNRDEPYILACGDEMYHRTYLGCTFLYVDVRRYAQL